MCKIFFTYKSRHSKELLQKFLETSITEKWKDGYGISWWKKHQWNTYKQPMFYSHDQNYQNVFDNIDTTNVIAAHLRYILTKDIPEHKVIKEKAVENTHPFEHENNIFLHRGDLFVENNKDLLLHQTDYESPVFTSRMQKLDKYMSAEYRRKIIGNTDSEILFYLFLSIVDKVTANKSSLSTPNISKKKILLHSFHTMMKLLVMHNIETSSSFLFSDGDLLLASNIYINHSSKYIKPLELYIDTKDGITISSIKLNSRYRDFGMNKLLLLNLNTGNWKTYEFLHIN
jgi:predicted glutamine amidotransferase